MKEYFSAEQFTEVRNVSVENVFSKLFNDDTLKIVINTKVLLPDNDEYYPLEFEGVSADSRVSIDGITYYASEFREPMIRNVYNALCEQSMEFLNKCDAHEMMDRAVAAVDSYDWQDVTIVKLRPAQKK